MLALALAAFELPLTAAALHLVQIVAPLAFDVSVLPVCDSLPLRLPSASVLHVLATHPHLASCATPPLVPCGADFPLGLDKDQNLNYIENSTMRHKQTGRSRSRNSQRNVVTALTSIERVVEIGIIASKHFDQMASLILYFSKPSERNLAESLDS